MSKFYKKWDIVLVDLNPTKVSEISKTRPCLIVSPNAINTHLNTLIIVPFTTTYKNYPTRIKTNHKNKIGYLAFDQIKTIDKDRVVKRDGEITKNLRETINEILNVMFSEK